MDLKKFFSPASIAVVGASGEKGKIGNVLMKNLIDLGYAGEIFPVNPKHEEIFSRKCHKSLSSVPGKVDLAILAIPAKFVNDEIRANAERIKNYVVISAGFAEMGEEGKERERELEGIASKNGLNILGPNCLGFIVPGLKLNASFAGGMPASGNIAFVTQSGALAVAIMDKAFQRGLSFSKVISVGNKAVLSETEFLEYLAGDEQTKVIGMYLESIKEGSQFIETARKVSKSKPVVILKTGKNEKAQKAISSHTGALAGSDEVVSAVFKKAGVVRAESLGQFFDLLDFISDSSEISRSETAVITNAGGAGVLISDAFSGKEIKLAELGDDLKKELRKMLPEESSVENPIDLLGDAREDRYEKVLSAVLGSDSVGSVICILTPQEQTPAIEIAEVIVRAKASTRKSIATVFLGGEKIARSKEILNENGIANFEFPEDAVMAIDSYYAWHLSKKSPQKPAEKMLNKKRMERAQKLIRAAREENRKAMYFSEAAKLLDIYGIKTVRSVEILPDDQDRGEEKLDFPLALKVDSDKVLHKTDKKALVLGIRDLEEFRESSALMRVNFPKERFIAQKMAEKGTELIIGMKRDAVFGPVIVYGLGGIYTEYLRMVEHLIAPLGVFEAEDSLVSGKLGFLFRGVRGQEKYDAEEVGRILTGLGLMALENPEILEFDMNPLIIYNDGKEAAAVDVKIVF